MISAMALKGYSRKKAIELALEEWGAMDAEQLQYKFFEFRYGKRKCQEIMKELHDAKKVHRWRGEGGRYCYSLEPPNAQSQHRIMTNWVRMWFESCRPNWEEFHCFQYEQDYGILRTDGFVAMKDYSQRSEDRFQFWFVELDRSPRNKFDKVPKYCRLMKDGGYSDRWWVELTERFPHILVVTVSEARRQKILEHIHKENTAGLKRWEVRLFDELKGAVRHEKAHG